tara:strand:+ start:40 stop:795 length:756 start_codon:yes stop_codon:yes gene_type:complete
MIKDYKTNLIPREHHAFFTNKKVDCDQSCTKLDFSFFKKGEIQNSMSNRNLAAKSLGCDPKQVCFLNQIHSSKVLVVDSTLGQLKKPADGMVTNVKGVGLAILTADCAPVLFFDPIAKIIGAAHAGWRGAVDGIVENTVDKMLTLGATKPNILVAIGPCISQINYEVGEDFKKKIIFNNNRNNKYFFRKSTEKLLFNLCGFIIGKLKNHGISNISAVRMCTYDEKNDFHSYRRAIHKCYDTHQRNMSLIKL